MKWIFNCFVGNNVINDVGIFLMIFYFWIWIYFKNIIGILYLVDFLKIFVKGDDLLSILDEFEKENLILKIF